MPPNSPIENITFGFGGPGVIAYIDLNGQFGTGSFTTAEMTVHLGTIVSIRRVASSSALGGLPGVEIHFFSDDEFPVRNEILLLLIGARTFFLSAYLGDLNNIVFTLTEKEFAEVAYGEPVIVQYGAGPSNELWQFGNLDKSILAVRGRSESFVWGGSRVGTRSKTI